MTANEKEIVNEFCGQYVRLRVVYDDYCALYEKGPERIKLLEEIASHFFARLSYILIQFMEMRICALTDPPETGGHKNLTVKYILGLVGPQVSEELGLDELSVRIDTMRSYIIEGRNKGIAHLDKKALLSKEVFGTYPREVWDQFWQSLQEFVNKVHKHCFGSIRGDVRNSRGAGNLVEALKRAVHYGDYFANHTNLWASEVQKMRYKDA